MSTQTQADTTPKTAAQAWAAIHQACGNAVRAQLEDDDIEGAFYYAKRMAKAEARIPELTVGTTLTVSNAWKDSLTTAEEYALGHRDSDIIRYLEANRNNVARVLG